MSLYRNINRRKRKGISRPKSKSTISAKAYRNMKAGFPNSKKIKLKEKEKLEGKINKSKDDEKTLMKGSLRSVKKAKQKKDCKTWWQQKKN